MSYDTLLLYKAACKWYTLIPPMATLATTFYNAPFGRFSRGGSRWMVDGIKSWIVMELVSPLCFTLSYLTAPLQPPSLVSTLSSRLTLSHPPTLLFLAFLIHYANRALISPLRTPSRSKAHLIVPLAAIGVNLVNGTLMGTYLSSPQAEAHLRGAYGKLEFWVLMGIWAAGMAGNVLHDEVLLNLRRDSQRKREKDGDGDGVKKSGEHYAIPHGYLFRYISYPNYFCEWIEWAAFAFAAAPLPVLASVSPSSTLLTRLWTTISTGGIAPPWLFFLMEFWTMAPRAYRGHEWYHQKFGASYPKDRRAVVPFLF